MRWNCVELAVYVQISSALHMNQKNGSNKTVPGDELCMVENVPVLIYEPSTLT